MKKVLSVLLAVCLLLGVCPVLALADGEEPAPIAPPPGAQIDGIRFVRSEDELRSLIREVAEINGDGEQVGVDLSGLGDEGLNAPYIYYSGLEADKAYTVYVEMASASEPVEQLIKPADAADFSCGIFYLLPETENIYSVQLIAYDSYEEDKEPTGRSPVGEPTEFKVVSGLIEERMLSSALPEWAVEDGDRYKVFAVDPGFDFGLEAPMVAGTPGEWTYSPRYNPEDVAEDGSRPYYYDLQYFLTAVFEDPYYVDISYLTDVKADDWFCENVRYVVGHGLMTGRSENVFAPKAYTNRAELVVTLYRMEGEPEPDNFQAIEFPDAKADWYKNAVSWAAENGIVSGYSDGTFRPTRDITREEFALILARFARYKGILTDSLSTAPGGDNGGYLEDFIDHQETSGWARDDLGWAVKVGVVTGYTGDCCNTYIMPKDFATRAQTAAMLQRFCENVLTEVEELSYPVDLELDGKTVLSVSLPGSWKDNVTTELLANEDGGSSLRICDKLNSEYDGWLFSVRLIPSENEWDINNSKFWGAVDIDGKLYDVAFCYPSDVRFGETQEQQESYRSKYVQCGQVFRDGVSLGEGVKLYEG